MPPKKSSKALEILACRLIGYVLKRGRIAASLYSVLSPDLAMRTDPLPLSRDARRKDPYGSLLAAILFQNFRDAIAEELSTKDHSETSKQRPSRHLQNVPNQHSPFS